MVPGAVAATIVAVALILWFGVGLLFPHPCLSFGPIPAQSGVPDFPRSNTTDFAGTWCPTATPLFSIHPQLTILINGHPVALPPAIGESNNFTRHACILPLHTQAGLGAGIFNVTSPWAYDYSLGNFFSVWQSSYVSAYVNASYSTRTISYTPTQILGLPADASHSLSLFVDNQLSSAGPGLLLNGLNNVGGAYPSCIDSIYGSGHTIAIVYKSLGTGAVVSAPVHPTLSTEPAPLGALTLDHHLGDASTGATGPGARGIGLAPSWLLLRPPA